MKKKAILLIVLIIMLLDGISVFAMVPYETYFYDSDGTYFISPDAYVPEKVLKAKDMELGDLGLKNPSDLVVDKENNVYIADSGNNRIVILDENYRFKFEIKEFYADGSVQTLNAPAGLFVTEDGRIYVADSKNFRIVLFEKDGTFVRIFDAPDSDVFPEGFMYEPSALGVDPAGRMYVVSKSTNMGIMALNADGGFEGFIGAEKVVPNVLDIFWDLITTDEQKRRTAKNVPTEYNNITMDDIGFAYVTSSAIPAGNQRSAMMNRDKSSHYAPVKRLNSTGIDVLKRNGSFPPAGDIRNNWFNVSRFIDVALTEDGVYSTLDTTHNKIFTYDDNGNLLYVFGGTGTQEGVFENASALAYQGTKLLVVDRNTGYITVFRRTEYGDCIAEAIHLQKNRRYDEAIIAWEKVLKRNPYFELAYSGAGQSNMRKENYKEAMANYKLANDWDNYFKAYSEYRKDVVRKIILLIPVIVAAVIGLCMAFFKYVRKVNEAGWQKTGKRTLWEELLYSFHIMFHPFDGFWDLKHEKRGSAKTATVILALVMAVDIFRTLAGGYALYPTDFRAIDLQDTVLKVLIPFMLWVCANWGLTTLMDGEGSFKDIYTASAYSLMPIVVINIPVTILSNFIVLNELQFVNFFTTLAYAWAFALIFFGVLVTNAYGLVKNLVTSALSVVGMGFIAFISVLFINILQRMNTFITTLYHEIAFRL
ncbi:hypothetical protein CDQ84_07580 [Clostridium thermosuccinogenes]|jgi:tetratricopeptide (TPR) repeat protein|uniref:Yip1 domain-containing protein n=1 Tax=Clostridium thermosuccinogenes TaxID=84032 RepID=A0A2K2FGI1_9CLOT|nr:YIP1 family protein [Pseudoclostridium thermosuccinogenes]AUS95929.1 hypothetical protein CDO33_05425 [Pseudoclostridium thermosuccinogenes]PNT97884.1 hypothetical protein CDQ85_07080 [Pseudoclostridium thermosuccinogenes]PNT99816.1 hypothetical protein CDQ84_07580 [Pseudoclostridium thermosuccinogenes]